MAGKRLIIDGMWLGMYRERYDLSREYMVLSRESVEKLLAGKCSCVADVMAGSFTSKIEEAATILTVVDGNVYQYSVVSNNRSGLPEINVFSSTAKKSNVFSREDIGIVASERDVLWMVSHAQDDNFRKMFMGNMEFNCGRILKGFQLSVGSPAGDTGGIIAGYLIKQKKSCDVQVANIVLPVRDYTDFMYEFDYFDDALSVLKQYLTET